MTNPFVSNVYGAPDFGYDEPQSFSCILYSNPAPQVITVFRGALQAPQFEWWRDSYDWIQDTPLALKAFTVHLRPPLQAADFSATLWDWRPAWNVTNTEPLYAAVAHPRHHRPLGSDISGSPNGIIGSVIVK